MRVTTYTRDLGISVMVCSALSIGIRQELVHCNPILVDLETSLNLTDRRSLVLVTLTALVGLLNNPLGKRSKIVKGSGEIIHQLNC